MARQRWRGGAVVAAILLTMPGCRSVPAPSPLTARQLQEAMAALSRPLTADLAALYKLRVPKAGNLRLSVVTRGDAGRLSVNGSFGAAHSLVAWTGNARPLLFDLRHGCRIEATDVSAVLGVADLALPQAIHLLAGRLPATAADQVQKAGDGRLLVQGSGSACLVTVAPAPWRVLAVEQVSAAGGWSITIEDHAQSVPSLLQLAHPDGSWATLDLVGLQWKSGQELAPLPDLPRCGQATAGQ